MTPPSPWQTATPMTDLPDITVSEYMTWTEDDLLNERMRIFPLCMECDCRENPLNLWPRPCHHYDNIMTAIEWKTADRLQMVPPGTPDGFGDDLDLTSVEYHSHNR